MAVVVLNGKPVEVSDILVDVEALKLRLYLQIEHGNGAEAKLREIRLMLRHALSPSKILALRKVQKELQEASA